MTDATALAREIASIASDSHATDIQVLDIHSLSPIADFFVLASADNTRLLRTIEQRIRETLRDEGLRPLRVEGLPEHGWIVIDYGDVIVHLLTIEQREYYRLEDLWSEAHRLLVIQ